MIGVSIPVAIPVKEHFRLLAYLKAAYKVGFFPKTKIPVIRKALNKDMRSVKKYIVILLNDGLIGQDDRMIYLRSWSFILYQIESKTLQAFRVQDDELMDKSKFESMVLSAKIKVLEKASRLKLKKERSKGCSNQIEISTGALSSLCNISFGKVSQLKQIAKDQGLIEVESNSILLDLPPKSLKYLDKPEGVYVKNGKVYKRGMDKIISLSDTFKKRNWRKK
jgi:peptidyl-tRNA hydrolase